MLPIREFLKEMSKSFLFGAYFPVSHNISTLSNTYRVNPLLSSLGGLFISNPFEGGGLSNFQKMMVSRLSKELESGKAQVQTVGGHAAEDQKHI